jgi:hypothetical protein
VKPQRNSSTVLCVNFSRRHLIAAAGSAVLLAACGEDSKSGSATTLGNATPSDGTGAPDGGWAIVQRFPGHPLFVPGEESRLVVSLADKTRMLDNGPATLSGWIEDFNGTRITDITGIRRSKGIPTPYWEVRAP